MFRRTIAPSIPVLDRMWRRPRAADRSVVSSSSGSAMRSRAKGTPMMAHSDVAEPAGAPSSDERGSSEKRHTEVPSGNRRWPMAGDRSRATVRRRSTPSAARPTAAPMIIAPKRAITRMKRERSLLTRSAGFRLVMSEREHTEMEGVLADANSVRWRLGGGG